MRLQFHFSLAGLFLVLSISAASAQPKEDAAELFGKGLSLFADKKYEEAAVALETSYEAKPEQRTLFAWAQAVRLSGQCEKSRELLAKYVANGANDKQSRAAFKLMEDCVQAPPNTDTTTNETNTDGNSQTTNQNPVTETNAGESGLSDAETGNTAITSGMTDPVGPSSSTQGNPWYKDWIAVSLLSAGVISLGVSGATYATALSLESDGMEEGTTLGEFLDLQDRSETHRNTALIFGTGGALLVGAGITYIVLRDDSGGKESATPGESFSVRIDGNSAGFALSGRF